MTPPARLLVVDDNEKIHEDFSRVLTPHVRESDAVLAELECALFGDDPSGLVSPAVSHSVYEVDFASQGERALNLVRLAHDEGRPYSVIFMDVRMPPGWDGIETIERIWAEFPHVEAVICSAYSDYRWEEIVGRLGETDRLLFLSKPFEPIEVQQMALTLSRKWLLGLESRNYIKDLESQVARRTSRLELVLAELEAKNATLEANAGALEYLALHDELTGLGNRSLFRNRLEHMLAKSRRSGELFSVLLLDADGFKRVNDDYGHHVGDEVLAAMAARLTGALRESDTVARLGGDEFGVLLSGVSGSDSLAVAGKIVAAVERPLYVEANSEPIIPRLSAGIAVYPEHGLDVDQLLKNADLAMYQAKGSPESYVLMESRPEG